MRRGKAAVKFNADAAWLTFSHGGLLCVFNFAADAQRVRLPSGEWDLVLRSDGQGAESAAELPGKAVFIYRCRGEP